MAKKFFGLLAATIALGGTATLFSQDKAGEGTLMVQDKNYTLKHALAYETMMDDAEMIVVVLSGQVVSAEKLKEARAAEKDGHDASFNAPYLKLAFSKSKPGELSRWSAGAGNSFMNKGPSNVTAELKTQDGRAIGKASMPNETEGNFRSGFDVRFDTKLFAASESLPAAKKPGPAANVKPTVTGVFKGNGKEAKIAYVSAHWGEPFSGKPSIVLVFTEKDHSKAKKPDFDASFGRFGSALVISLHEDGNIFGCQVAHSAHKKQGFSSVGQIKTDNFQFADGKVEGELLTDKELEFFGDTWEVNLKFVAPLGEIPKEFQVPEEKTTEKPETKKQTSKDAADDDDDADDEKSTTKPAGDQLKVKELAITKDATDIEYKASVEHVTFKSKGNTKAVCTELTANLQAQGWTKDGSDLITPASSILKRKRKGATLTIFVKPEGGGSEVKIFTEGLAWEK